MDITLTTEIIIMVVNAVLALISLAIMWQKLTSRIEALEKAMEDNATDDKELRIKVESLEKLFSKIEVLETKQNAQNEAIHYSIGLLNTNIEKLTNKLDSFVEGYNNVRIEVEGLKKNA